MQIFYVLYIVLIIALMAAAYLLTPSPKKPKDDDKKLEIPTVEEGKTIGIVYGTVEIRDPIVISYWDLKIITEVKEGGKKQ